MKFIHLSDLHIGKRLHEASLLEDQAHILRSIVDIVRREKPQAVLICGDVYDKSVPSAEAVTLFDEFLCDLAALDTKILIISGNHDSAERLAFGNRLMEGAGIHVSPAYGGHIAPVTIEDEFGAVDFWLLPFLKPIQVRRFFPEAAIETYTDACRTAVMEMNPDFSRRNVLLAHQFVTGAEVCEGDELSVGGSDNVDAAAFDGFDYVALGHIHGPQNLGSSRIRYCGTPLKYSFSESAHHKSVTVVTLEEKGSLQLRAVPLYPKRELRELRGSFAFLTGEGYREEASDDYLHLILTDEDTIPEAVSRLRSYYPNALSVTYDNKRTRENQVVGMAEDVQNKSPLALFEELYQRMNNQPMSPRQSAFMGELIGQIWEDTQ